MDDMLVGNTGFVGSNIAAHHAFSSMFHSTDITDAYGKKPDLLVYAGVPAAMFIANRYPQKDLEMIRNAMYNIEKIMPQKVVLISTVAVYGDPVCVDENTAIDEAGLSTYGANRRRLEIFVEENYADHLIIRLPALFGTGLKKNFIYDLIHLIPSLLDRYKYGELLRRDDLLEGFYIEQDDGFYKCRTLNNDEERILRRYFKKAGFSAVDFTDSRSVYQFYGLAHLWEHILRALDLGIHKLNMATEPIDVCGLYKELTGSSFINEFSEKPFFYDLRCSYAEDFGGRNGYIYDKETVIEEIKAFVRSQQKVGGENGHG